MKLSQIKSGGYIGLVMLLIGVALTVFLFVKYELPLLQKNTTATTTPSSGEAGPIDTSASPIDQAHQAKDLLEQNSRRNMDQMP